MGHIVWPVDCNSQNQTHKKAETILKCQCSQSHCCGKDTGSCILACSMRGNIAGRWGATWRCIHSTFSLPQKMLLRHWKDKELSSVVTIIGSVQQPELHMGWMITTKLVSAQIISNKLREELTHDGGGLMAQRICHGHCTPMYSACFYRK